MTVNQIIPEIIVDDICSMIAYYQKYFDFVLDATDSEGDIFTWAQLTNGSCTIMMQETEVTKQEIPGLDMRLTGTDLLMFKLSTAEEVKELYKRFESVRDSIYMELRMTDYGSCEFGVKDPEGRYIIVSG